MIGVLLKANNKLHIWLQNQSLLDINKGKAGVGFFFTDMITEQYKQVQYERGIYLQTCILNFF